MSILFLIVFLGLSFGSLSSNEKLNETGTLRLSNMNAKKSEVLYIAGSHKGRIYKVQFEPRLNWLDALLECVKQKGMLTDLRDHSDYDFIRNLSSVLPSQYYQRMWVGSTDLIFEGRYEWLTKNKNKSKPMDFFKAHEPDGKFDENCCAMLINSRDRDPRGFLFDAKCRLSYSFICVFGE